MIGAGGFILLQGFSSGPASSNRDVTGGPFGSNNCSMCHSGGNFTSSLAAVVTDASGATVTEYIAGQTYTVTFTVNATGASGYGMQMVSLDASNNQAGTLSNTSSNAKVTSLNGRQYLEHNRRSSSNTFTAEWTAPAAGTGSVTIYASGMAVNANGGTSGDDPTTSITATLVEGSATGVHTVAEEGLTMSLFPVPNNGSFSLQNNQSEPVQRVRIVTLAGKEVAQQNVHVVKGATEVLNFENLTPGIYTIVAEGETIRQVQNIVVQ